MRQINRRNCPQFITAVRARAPYEDETCRRLGSEVSLPLWTEERAAGVWDFRGGAGNFQVDEKEQKRATQIPAGPPGNSGTQREVRQGVLC